MFSKEMNKNKLLVFCLVGVFCLLGASLVSATTLNQKLKGKILLQVQNKGEAWYVYPVNLKKYYLGRPADAFKIMKELGLGVTHEYLLKYKENVFPVATWGKILIDVGDSGKAYYIYPVDGTGYYLGKPEDAFNVMRNLGLGITNADLAKIESFAAEPVQSKVVVAQNGCLYNNPSCDSSFDCVNNVCVKKNGCSYSNPPCGSSSEKCFRNTCVETQFLLTGVGIQLLATNSEKDNVMLMYKALGEYPSESKIYYSNDYGVTWYPVIDVAKYKLANFAFDNNEANRAYAINDQDVYSSGDYGQTFQHVGKLPNDFYVRDIFADRFVARKIYVAVGSEAQPDFWGLLVSMDGGVTFEIINFGDSITVPSNKQGLISKRIIWDINQDPQDPKTLYVTSEQGTHTAYGRPFSKHNEPYYILRTRDGGKNWEAISDGLEWHCIAVFPIINPTSKKTEWFAGYEGGSLFVFNDTIYRWEQIVATNTTTTAEEYVCSEKPQRIILAGYANIDISDNYGVSGSWHNFLHNADARMASVTGDSSGNVYVGDYLRGLMKIKNLCNID